MTQAHKRAVEFMKYFNTCKCEACEGFKNITEEEYLKEIFDILKLMNDACDEVGVPVATRAEAMAIHIGNCIFAILHPKDEDELGKNLDLFYNTFVRPSVVERFSEMNKRVEEGFSSDKLPKGLEEFVREYLKKANKGLKPEDGPMLGMLDVGFTKDGKFTILNDEKFDVPDKIKFGDEEIDPKAPDEPENK